MSTASKLRRTGILVGLLLITGLAVGIAGLDAPQPLVVRLEARDLGFVRPGDAALNPTLVLPAGARVKLILDNRDPGMRHDLVVPDLDLGTRRIPSGESDAIVFDVPRTPGSYAYLCTLHAAFMQGTIVVR